MKLKKCPIIKKISGKSSLICVAIPMIERDLKGKMSTEWFNVVFLNATRTNTALVNKLLYKPTKPMLLDFYKNEFKDSKIVVSANTFGYNTLYTYDGINNGKKLEALLNDTYPHKNVSAENDIKNKVDNILMFGGVYRSVQTKFCAFAKNGKSRTSKCNV